MKKLFTLLFLLGTIFTLQACSQELPEGISERFYYDAQGIYNEIDEDVAEGEFIDRDDIGNYNAFVNKYTPAHSDEEQAVLDALSVMFSEGQQIIEDINYPLDQYIPARGRIARIMEWNVPEFQFTEGDAD